VGVESGNGGSWFWMKLPSPLRRTLSSACA
jgi:hypothetical protein